MSRSETQAEAIFSREDFASFVRALLLELQAGGKGWEDTDLPRFLDALAAWVEDMDGYYANRNEPVPTADWRTFARMLLAA